MAAATLLCLSIFLLINLANSAPTPEVSCPSGYFLNPHSNTCIRRVGLHKSWYDAMFYCQAAGEHLVTFDDWESMNWIELMHRTVPAWRNGDLWLGVRKTNGQWRWAGRKNSQLELHNFGWKEPSGNGNCVQSYNSNNNNNILSKWDDYSCSSHKPFLCERSNDLLV